MLNLLMSASDEAWDNGLYVQDRSRFLEHTDTMICERFTALDASAVQVIKSMPALFAHEASSAAPAKLGRITDVEVLQRELRLRFQLYSDFVVDAKTFISFAPKLEINKYELHRTHWAIKSVDVFAMGLFRSAPPTPQLSRRVFVVHGHDHPLKDAVANCLTEFGLEPVILHLQADMGQTVIEKFEGCSDVGFAVVLLTPDDAVENGPMRARQNVILELGYFIGKLGRARVCALRKGRVEMPSDIFGVLYKSVDETGSWKSELVRELEAAGYARRAPFSGF